MNSFQSVLRKVKPEDAPQISDAIMTALLQMFNSNSCKSGGVQEDALMAVATLVEVLGEGFIKYMEAFKPFLCIGLKNHEEYQVKLLLPCIGFMNCLEIAVPVIICIYNIYINILNIIYNCCTSNNMYIIPGVSEYNKIIFFYL